MNKLKVFLCHANKDRSSARKLYTLLLAEDRFDYQIPDQVAIEAETWSSIISTASETSKRDDTIARKPCNLVIVDLRLHDTSRQDKAAEYAETDQSDISVLSKIRRSIDASVPVIQLKDAQTLRKYKIIISRDNVRKLMREARICLQDNNFAKAVLLLEAALRESRINQRWREEEYRYLSLFAIEAKQRGPFEGARRLLLRETARSSMVQAIRLWSRKIDESYMEEARQSQIQRWYEKQRRAESLSHWFAPKLQELNEYKEDSPCQRPLYLSSWESDVALAIERTDLRLMQSERAGNNRNWGDLALSQHRPQLHDEMPGLIQKYVLIPSRVVNLINKDEPLRAVNKFDSDRHLKARLEMYGNGCEYDPIDNRLKAAYGSMSDTANLVHQSRKRHDASAIMFDSEEFNGNIITGEAQVAYWIDGADHERSLLDTKMGMIEVAQGRNPFKASNQVRSELDLESDMKKREEVSPSAKEIIERFRKVSKSRLSLDASRQAETLKEIEGLAEEIKIYRFELKQNRFDFSRMVGIDIVDLIMVENITSDLETARAVIEQINRICDCHLGMGIAAFPKVQELN